MIINGLPTDSKNSAGNARMGKRKSLWIVPGIWRVAVATTGATRCAGMIQPDRQSDFALKRCDKTLGTPAIPAFIHVMDKARLFRLRLGTGKAHRCAAFDTFWFDGETLGIVFRHCSSLGKSVSPGLIFVIEKANPHFVSSKPN
jgi:hypothetical protein